MERVGNQDSSDRSPEDDDQFRGLQQNPYIAVFHQVAGNHGAKDHYDSYNRKHRCPNLRIAPDMSGENGDAIPAFLNAFLKRRYRTRHEQLSLIPGPATSTAHRAGHGELVTPPLNFRLANHSSDALPNQ